MKTKIFKTMLPFVAIVLAVAGAFAFNQAPTKGTGSTLKGYIRIAEGDCEKTDVDCTDVIQPNFCSNGTNWLHEMNLSGTDCPDPLYRIN
ncbi:DUF6520 family protein [Flavobacterium sp. GT3P67]|uniref:DUF6520 family protein n=1 Tax=Flavobacterium sp. GT3P67 TaxID=2541722 RepID=UPI00104E7ABD|nr:DUF6520 family protein [Flavobacterium sp. GT3P67]TDE51270.1 hypothetical protein E0H99_11710 [Flavobacterium sp. GT3P67]